MTKGEINVAGDVGIQAGRVMQGGRLTIGGNAGPWAASGMKAGTVEISGHAGERIGGPLAGETVGMRGGVVVVRGDAGARAGDRVRARAHHRRRQDRHSRRQPHDRWHAGRAWAHWLAARLSYEPGQHIRHERK